MDVLILGISKFVAKVRIICELANFRNASRTGDYGSASRTGNCGTGGTSGTGETGGTGGTGRNEDIFSSFGRVNSYLYFGDCSFIVR